MVRLVLSNDCKACSDLRKSSEICTTQEQKVLVDIAIANFKQKLDLSEEETSQLVLKSIKQTLILIGKKSMVEIRNMCLEDRTEFYDIVSDFLLSEMIANNSYTSKRRDYIQGFAKRFAYSATKYLAS